MTPWWSEQTATMIGAFGGAAIGILGGIVGTLGGIMVPRGKGKRLVYGSVAFLGIIGLPLLILGLVALVVGQPYAVWFSPLMAGVVCVACVSFVFPGIARGYRLAENNRLAAEKRRLDAEELRRS
ncbi:MAG: hypothetical protein FWD53_06125 [Phycisphaerales bacterium]|nr:hypothetical protein [Phycisphaerales bacterium]